jgi:hypothetical protein
MIDLLRRLADWLGLRLMPGEVHCPADALLPPLPLWPLDAEPLPPHRSPYGLETLLDGAETVAVRPYLWAEASGGYWGYGTEVA